MDDLAKIIVQSFQYIDPKDVLNERVSCHKIETTLMKKISYAVDKRVSESTIQKKLQHLSDRIAFEFHEDGKKAETQANSLYLAVFDLVNSFAREVLVCEKNEMLYKYEYLKIWHYVRSKIGEDVIVAAAYAHYDYKNAFKREAFLWKRMIDHNNVMLNKILDRGLSDNHYHLRCSTPYFELSWLTLMNSVNDIKLVKYLDQIDRERRNPRVQYQSSFEEKYSILHIQAALIRVYLYSCLTGRAINLGPYSVSEQWVRRSILESEEVEGFFEHWKREAEERDCTFCVTFSRQETWREYLEQFLCQVSQLLYEEPLRLQGELRNQCPKFYRFFWQKFPSIPIREIRTFEDLFSRETLSSVFRERARMYDSLELEQCEDLFLEEERSIFQQEWRRQTKRVVYRLLKNSEHLVSKRKKIQTVIDSFQNFEHLEQKDYAMSEIAAWDEKDWERAIISGERWLLYTMLHKQYEKDLDDQEKLFDLFYMYLLMKESFRMELIQSNDGVGFENFQNYQRRKDWFSTNYSKLELAKMAVREAFGSQRLLSLELRVMPEHLPQTNISVIQAYDSAFREGNSLVQSSMSEQQDYRDKFYYVFHFSKRVEEFIREENFVWCRHEKYRSQVKEYTNAILLMREKNFEVAKRLRGIDACSSEDGCRPEVFAVAFRVLKNHVVYKKETDEALPQLRVSYHVGEENQDILDGLRAIDEAVYFLNLDSGDRLGHATALGISVEEWYEKQGFKIAIRRHDYLDNIVWLYYKLLYYQIPEQEGLLKYLEKEFDTYFRQIYLKQIDQKYHDNICEEAVRYDNKFGNTHASNRWQLNFSIYSYYNAWELRGDDPSLYKKGFYRRNKFPTHIWDDCAINKLLKREKRYRLESGILYHLYHYNTKIKEEGDKSVVVKIPLSLVRGISMVQKGMQREIAKKGIAIETNPSSNILISSLDTYEEHPILSFYNKGLVNDPEKQRDCMQLNVSINTDDAGVFSTNLKNEYTLMAGFLEEQKDRNREPVYKKDMIYDWINQIRIMGNNQHF